MPVLDLSAYKPVPATLGDANQVANGMQAIQNCINALDNNNFAAGRIFDPAKLMQNAAIDGDPLVWDNTLVKWVPASTLAAGRPRAPRVVVSTMAGGPPASPVDQDIWIATAVDANGTRQAFQYNAGSASAFKWEYIGGAPARAKVAAGETTGTLYTNYADLATVGPSVVAVRAGDYIVRAKCNADNGNAASQVAINFRSTTVAEDDDNLQYASSAIANAEVPLFTEGALLGVAAGDTIKMRYTVIISGTGTFRRRHIAVTPIRIS